MSDLHHLSAVEQRDALRNGDLAAVELTEHYLRRIDLHNDALGAFVTITADLALEEAKQADERLRRSDEQPPPLLGLPVPIKDLSATAGVRTTFGSAAFADFVPPADSWTVSRIRGAGAVLLGKTNVPEFGPTCYTDNDLDVGPAVTPYDLGRYASGSSGGAAAAVAAGLAPVAHGSDGAGSIRTPAGACGLIGYKPSRGAVSAYPLVAFTSFGVEGPLARSLDDAALLADVMTVRPAGELWPDARPSGAGSLREALRRDQMRLLRVGWWTGTGVDGIDPHPSVVDAVRRVAAALDGAGHIVDEIEPPAVYDERIVQAVVMKFGGGIGAAVATVPAVRRALLRPVSRHFLDVAANASAVDGALADATLANFAAAVLTRTADYDLLLCPTTSGPPVPVGWFSEGGPAEEAQRMVGWSCGTPFANFTGHCALSLPLAWTGEGLPIGVQLAMPAGRDHDLFAIAGRVLDESGPRPTPSMY